MRKFIFDRSRYCFTVRTLTIYIISRMCSHCALKQQNDILPHEHDIFIAVNIYL